MYRVVQLNLTPEIEVSYMLFDIQSRPLVRSAFCPKKIDHTNGLTLHLGYNLLEQILNCTIQK